MLEMIAKAAQVAMSLLASMVCFLFAGAFVVEGFTAGDIVVTLFSVFIGIVFALVGTLFAAMTWTFLTD